MAPNVRGERIDVFRRWERLSQHAGRDIVAEDEPGGTGPLFVVKRVFAGGHFPKPGESIAPDLDQDDVTRISAGEAGLEKMDQRHPDLSKLDLIEFHLVKVFWSHGSSR